MAKQIPIRPFIALVFGVGVLSLLAEPTSLRAQDTSSPIDQLSVEKIMGTRMFMGGGLPGIRWTDQGASVTYVQRNRDGTTDLVEYDLRSEERSVLVKGSTLRPPDVDGTVPIEEYTFGPDRERLLIFTDTQEVWRYRTKGFYYVYDVETGELIPLSDRDKGYQMFAKFSPDAKRVGFVRNRDLYVIDLSTGQESRLTESGSDGGIINGTSDWVYEEEFGLRDGWSWSPNGEYIAFFQLDESDVPTYPLLDYRPTPYPELREYKYPKAGRTNSEIHIGLAEVTTGELRFFDTGTWNAGADSLEYIPRMGWTPEVDGSHRVWIFRMNRRQNHLDLLYGDPQTMELAQVLEETSDTYLEVETGFTDLNVGKINYLPNDEQFVWVSSRSGWRHLYLYDNTGELVRPITSGNWIVTDFHGITSAGDSAYVTGVRDNARQRHLYRVSMQSERSSGPGVSVTRITDDPGWHEVNMSPSADYYLDTYSTHMQPPVTRLNTTTGKRLRTLVDNAALRDTLARYDLPHSEFLTVEAADGTPLNAYLIKPTDFDSTRTYPLLLSVYGGPGAQSVRNQWGGIQHIWHAYLVEKYDIIVGSVDNRGTGGRGKNFRDQVYLQLGQLESRDQISAARQLASRPYVDSSRVGMWGWSYGGYLTLLSMLRGDGPDTFHVGVAVAPVTDWRLYDTIYTERYMRRPQNNSRGYKRGSPITYADQLKPDQNLFIVHGHLDDNVHAQHTLNMVGALQHARKNFKFMLYPGKDHSLSGGGTRLHLFSAITRYIKSNLQY